MRSRAMAKANPPPPAPAAAAQAQRPAPPQRKQFVPGKAAQEKAQRRKEMTIPSEGKGPGWVVAILFLIIGFALGAATEHFVGIFKKILVEQ